MGFEQRLETRPNRAGRSVKITTAPFSSARNNSSTSRRVNDFCGATNAIPRARRMASGSQSSMSRTRKPERSRFV